MKRFPGTIIGTFGVAMIWFMGLSATTAEVVLAPDSPSPHRPSGVLQPFNYADVSLTSGPVAAQAQQSREFFLAIQLTTY
jgi:hypothetical protein